MYSGCIAVGHTTILIIVYEFINHFSSAENRYDSALTEKVINEQIYLNGIIKLSYVLYV